MCHLELGETDDAHSPGSQKLKQKPALCPVLDRDFNRDLPLSMNSDELPSSLSAFGLFGSVPLLYKN